MKSNSIDLKNFENSIKEQLTESIGVKEKILTDNNTLNTIALIAQKIIDCYKSGGKVILMGNGGSAADAQHLACELVSKFKMERQALPAVALNVNTSILTAVGNDYDFNNIFARQIEAWAKPEDIVIGISTSGNSENVISAVKKAKEIGSFCVAFTGETGGKLAGFADVSFKAPSKDTPRIQEAHITAGHIICQIVESALFE